MKKHYGKWLIITLPIIAALFLLYPTYRANILEKQEAENMNKALLAKNSEDSLKVLEKWDELHGKDLVSAKSNRVKLGLDLRGGMYVTMEVDVVKLIEESVRKGTMDEIMKEVLAKTRAESKQSDEQVVEVFLRNFKDIAGKKGKSLISYFTVGDIRNATDDKIVEKLKADAKGAIEQAFQVIRQRIDKYGVAEPTIQMQGSRRIML